jgi:hypothetical protein
LGHIARSKTYPIAVKTAPANPANRKRIIGVLGGGGGISVIDALFVALSTGIGLNGHGERIRAPASSSIDAFRRERAKFFLTSKIDAYQGASCRLRAIAATRKQSGLCVEDLWRALLE